MPALVITAAEIAAAEALAAEILIAQQATAATAATAEAVQVANAAQATQATTQAAQAAQATTQAAQATQTSASGLQALAQEVGTTVQPTGLETLNVATGPVPTAAEEQVLQAFQNAQANTPSMTGKEFLNNSYAGEVTALPSDFTAVGQAPVDAGMSAIKPAPDMSAQAVTHNFDSVKPFANPTFTAPPVEAATADFTAGTGEALGRGSYASPSAPAPHLLLMLLLLTLPRALEKLLEEVLMLHHPHLPHLLLMLLLLTLPRALRSSWKRHLCWICLIKAWPTRKNTL
jgi:hypothetical protein